MGKKVIHIAYSLGASVVLIGALFKIQHWPYASMMLTLGLITEAILFALAVFENPPHDYKWENVHPELLGEAENLGGIIEEADDFSQPAPIPVAATGGGGNFSVPTVALDEETQNEVNEKLRALAEASDVMTQRFSDIGEVSQHLVGGVTASAEKIQQGTDGYVQATHEAGEAIVNGANAVSETMVGGANEVSSNLHAYSDAVAQVKTSFVDENQRISGNYSTIANNLSEWNAICETQLQATQVFAQKNEECVGKFDNLSNSLENIATTYQESAKQSDALSQKLESLNAVYGNMLNSIS